MSDCIRKPKYLLNIEDNVSDLLSTVLIRDDTDPTCFKLEKLREYYVSDRKLFMRLIDELGLRGYRVETQKATNLFHEVLVEPTQVIFCESNEMNFLKIPFDQYGLSRLNERFNIKSDKFFNYIAIEQFTCLNANLNILGLKNEFEKNGFKFINTEQIKELGLPVVRSNSCYKEEIQRKASTSLCDEEIIVIEVEDMLGIRTNLQLPISFVYPDELKNISVDILFNENKFNAIKRYCNTNQITVLYQLTKQHLVNFLKSPGVGIGKFEQLIQFLMDQCLDVNPDSINKITSCEITYVGDVLIEDIFAERTYLHFREFCKGHGKEIISDLDSKFLSQYSQQKGVGKAKFQKIMIALKSYAIDDINKYLDKALVIKEEGEFLLDLSVTEIFDVFSLGEVEEKSTKLKDINGEKLLDLKAKYDPFKLIKLMDKIDSIRSLNSIVSGIQGILKEREYEFLLLRYKEGLTLQEVGDQMDVSRERIRQVLVKVVQKIRGYLVKNDFLLAIFMETKGKRYISKLELQNRLTNENQYIISVLKEGNDIIHYYEPLDLFYCNKNHLDASFIDEYFEQLPDSFRYYEYLPEFEDVFELLGIKGPSEELIEKLLTYYKIRRYGELCSRFRLYQLTALEYLFKYKISQSIRCDEQGISELRRLSKLYLNFDLEGADRSIEARIRDSRNIILVDSLTFSWFDGKFEDSLLREIKVFIDQILEVHGHINADQIFDQFSDRVARYSIHNKLHLYSIIRYFFDSEYKIGSRNSLMIFKNEQSKKTINSLLVNYVKQAGGCIDKEFLMNELKWPEYRVVQRVADSPEILLWSRDKIRLITDLKITEEQSSYINELVSNCMSLGYTSANMIIDEMSFDSNIATIFTQEKELNDPINLANYIKVLNPKIKGHANFLYNEESPFKNIEEYICHTLSQPTTRIQLKELLNRFGYSEQRYGRMINNLIESYKLVELSRDELISSDYYSMCVEDEKIVVDYLKEVMHDSRYMSLSKLIGYRRSLPIIEYQWTPHLLKSIAIKFGFKAINKIYSDWRYDPVIIVKSNSLIETYEDLIIDVLNNEYKGNMHMYDICDYLIAKGLLRIKDGGEKVFPYEIKMSQKIKIDELGNVKLN